MDESVIQEGIKIADSMRETAQADPTGNAIFTMLAIVLSVAIFTSVAGYIILRLFGKDKPAPAVDAPDTSGVTHAVIVERIEHINKDVEEVKKDMEKLASKEDVARVEKQCDQMAASLQQLILARGGG